MVNGCNLLVLLVATISSVPTNKSNSKTLQHDLDKMVQFSFNTFLCFMATANVCLIARLAIKNKCRGWIKSRLYWLCGLTYTIAVHFFIKSKFSDKDASKYSYSFCTVFFTAPHLFIHCPTFGTLWQHIRSWIGMSGVDPLTIDDHFTQFTHSSGHSKSHRSFLQLIRLLCVWLVWNERNNILYNNIQANIDLLVQKVKFHSLWWLKANKPTFVYDTHRWWSDSLLCLGIDRPSLLFLHCMIDCW